jgi:hypothetical protein
MRGRGRAWLPAALTSGAVLLVTAGIVVALDRPGGPPAGSGPSRSAPAGLDQLLVRDGDTVTASGTVVAAPGRTPRFCAPVPEAAVGSAGPEQPPSCSLGVDLVGADLDRLSDPTAFRGTRWGRAGITGRYAAGAVTVTSQGPPAADPYPTPRPLDPPPCPAPAGGWRPGALDRSALSALSALIEARPSAYGEVAMTYPDGRSGTSGQPTEVALVTTTLDPAQAEHELRTRFDGNLCVQPAVRSRAEVDAVLGRLLPSGGAGHDAALQAYREHQVFESGPDHLAGRVQLALVVLDQAAYAWLRGIDAGTGIIDARPWLRPATPR